MRDHRGFTLVELVVTLSVAAILVTLATPALRDTITRNQLAAQTNEFVRALSIARSEAVKRGLDVTVCNSSDGATCASVTDGAWEKGWIVFTDVGTRGTLDTEDLNGDSDTADANEADTVLLAATALPAGLALRGNSFASSPNSFDEYITYEPVGRSHTNGRFVLCRNGELTESRVMFVNRTGRVILGNDSDHNGIPEDSNDNDITTCNP